MDGLVLDEEPPQKLPTMIVAFGGWLDAAEAATGAVRHLVDSLGATRFAEIDPEEFFDFTVVRPQLRENEEGERVIRWPANDFYYHAPDDQNGGLLLFTGTEPNPSRGATITPRLLEVIWVPTGHFQSKASGFPTDSVSHRCASHHLSSILQ